MFDKIFVLAIVLCVSHISEAKIYNLNDTEYRKMPNLFELDDYNDCLLEPGGTYCMVDFDLFVDGSSRLMEMIQGYSEVTSRHLNHTQIHRGICVTQTCHAFTVYRDLNNQEDLRTILEACVNETTWKNYNIQAKVANLKTCKREGDVVVYDTSDYIWTGVLLVLVVLNSVGTFYDVFRKDDSKGHPYLLAFSVLRNWGKLVAPSGEGPEPRLTRLKLFNGLRAMTIICVIFCHATFVMTFSFVKNPLYMERSLDDPSKQILYNGSLVVSTFFVMSSFLLAFNFELHAEKNRVSWMEFPKGMVLRWLRLTPTYAFILGLVATVMRRLGSGPLWDEVVTTESSACRHYWWAHILYINNYIYDDYACMPQTWYLAADTQLFAIGLIFCIAVRTPRARKVILGLMMLVSLLTPALHTYLQDLDAAVVQAPESVRSIYKEDDTFRMVYSRTHTNLASYTLGLAGGLLCYRWLTDGKQSEEFKKFRYLIWLSFPLGVLTILSGALFSGADRAPLAQRVAYAALYKPVFQFLVVFFIINCVFKTENVYRRIVEWRGFTWMGRVSYGAFLVHTLILRGLVGSFVSPVYLTDYFILMILAATIFLSFLCACILWVCVETPVKELTKAALAPKHRRDIHNTKM